jgi:TolB-like protein
MRGVLLIPILLIGFSHVANGGEDDLVGLANRLASGVHSLKNKKVAVMTFPYHDGKISSGSSIVSERLTTNLVGRKGIQIIERRLIQKVFEEKKLSETGALDPQMAQTIGSILGVDAIITGTLIDLEGKKTEINARMIQSSTGEILAAAKTNMERAWTDAPRRPERAIAKDQPSRGREGQAFRESGRGQSQEDVHATKSPKKERRLSNENLPKQHAPVYTFKSNKNGTSGSQYHSKSSNDDYDSGDDSYYEEPPRNTYQSSTYRQPQPAFPQSRSFSDDMFDSFHQHGKQQRIGR